MQKKQHPAGNRKGLGGSRRSSGGHSGRTNKDDHAKSSRPSVRKKSDDSRRTDDNRRQERPYNSRQGTPYKAGGRPQLRRTSDDSRRTDDNRRQERPYDSRQGAPYKGSGRPQVRRTSDDSRRTDDNRRQERPYNSRQGTPYKGSGRPQVRRTSDDPRRTDDNRRQERPYDNRQGTPYKAGGRPQLRRTSDDSRRTDDNRRQERPYDRSQERPYGTRQNAPFKGGRPPHKANRPSQWKTNTKSNTKSSLAYDESIRLNKYIANAGICSRREADVLIATGAISVNGKVVTELGTKVMPADVIKYGDQRLVNEKKVYLLLNKPKDFITTSDDPQERKTVFDLIKAACKERIYPVGRLDRNTTGILLFTNDGELTKRLTHPKHGVHKLYHVHLDKALTKADAQSIMQGVQIDGTLVVPDSMEYTGKENTKNEIGIEIHSGQNRVIRRLFEQFGYTVVKLDRVVFAGLTKKDLPRGKWRFLSEKEVSFLKMLG